ncbi:MAG TPA: MFS transporter [Stellaceae bacterium]|jgi:putative MFS transporter|nr:MFS transporter [Stellaceae bacterium]
MLDLIDRQTRLTVNQWKIIVAAILGDMLDFFDFFLIGYVLAFIVGPWKLTYGESATVLLSAGLGAVPGAFFWGWMADKVGRRKVFILTALNFSIPTGLMALTPDGGWVYLTICRFLVGFGVSGLFAVDLPLVQEFVPTHKRGWVGGLVTACLPLGNIFGAALGAFVAPHFGWRWLFAIGLAPALVTLLIRAWVPESPRWLIRKGRVEEARRSIAWALHMDPKDIVLPTTVEEVPRTRWRELFKYPRSLMVGCFTSLSQTGGIGLLMWATTLLVLICKIKPAEAAEMMIWVGVTGFAGRLVCSYANDAIGRRPAGFIVGICGAVFMALAGFYYNVFIGTVSLFWVFIMIQRFFGDGAYAVIGPYSAEIFPAGLRTSGMGFGYGVGNLGKIIGPAGLALIVGSTNIVKPQANLDFILPAMLFLGFWYALSGVAFLFGIETKGRSIEEIDNQLTQGADRKTAMARAGAAAD